jgi:hypothetical protein
MIQHFSLSKGGVVRTLPQYLERRPEAIVTVAYFNLDLYEPSLKCLELIRNRLAKGSIVTFNDNYGAVSWRNARRIGRCRD